MLVVLTALLVAVTTAGGMEVEEDCSEQQLLVVQETYQQCTFGLLVAYEERKNRPSPGIDAQVDHGLLLLFVFCTGCWTDGTISISRAFSHNENRHRQSALFIFF
jgi:hypothetical protein